MKKQIRKLIFYLYSTVFLLYFTGVSCAGMGIAQSDARTAGLNGGLTAVADDILSIQYNPAGLCRIPFPELATSIGAQHVQLRDGTNMQKSFVAFAQPFSYLIPWRRDKRIPVDQAVGFGLYQFSVGSVYAEKILYFSYARQIYSRLSVGVTIKRLDRMYKSDPYMTDAIDTQGNPTGSRDPFFDEGKTKSAFTGDLGMLYRFGEFTRYALGFALRNITQPDLSIGTSKDTIPLVSVLGFAYRFPRLNVSIDWMRGKLLGDTVDHRFIFVGDKWFLFKKKGRVAARALLGIGSRNYRMLGLGCSYLFRQIRIDYGFSFPLSGIENTLGSHYLNINFRFGIQDPEEYFSPELRKKRVLRRLAEKEIKRAKHERELAEKSRRKALQEIEALEKLAFEMESRKASKRAARAEKNARVKYIEAYQTALEIYDKKKSEGLSLQKCMTLLERTIKEFKKLNIDVSAAKKQLKKDKKQLKGINERYQLTVFYYRKVVERGASINERKGILEKIIRKYRKYRIDLSEAENELKKLKQKKPVIRSLSD